MFIKRLSLLIVGVLALLSQSHAQINNNYFSIQGIFTDVSDLDVTGVADADSDSGFGIGAALGWVPPQSGSTYRATVELEVSFRNNDVDARRNSRSGEIESLAGMVNGLVYFNPDARLRPYFGAGIGVANVELDISGVADGDDSVLAYQFIVGGSYGFYRGTELLGRVPFNAEFFAEYRFFATDDPELETSGGKTRINYEVNNLLVGLRFRF